MALVLTLLLTLGALLLFALAMARHHRQLLGRPPSPRFVLGARVLGWILLALAPLPWMATHGALIAFVAWAFCGLPVAGLAVVAVCSFVRPARPDGVDRI